MEDGCEFGRWNELFPDALGLIFRKLPLREVLTVVPRVCKSWAKVVEGPYCWQEIDIEEWSCICRQEPLVDRMIRSLIPRSGGSLRTLSVSCLSSQSIFEFIGNNARSLQLLRLPRCHLLNDSVVEQVFGAFSNITYLDISYCVKIGARGLEAIGNQCKCLTGLRRVMQPLEIMNILCHDDEILVIASTMPNLKRLEIAYMKVTASGLMEVVNKCTQLELLDIRGCWYVNLDADFVKKFDKLKIQGPNVNKNDKNNWDICSEYSDCYIPWDFEVGDLSEISDFDDFHDEFSDDSWGVDQLEEDVELEMWFYDDLNAVDGAYDWPQSP